MSGLIKRGGEQAAKAVGTGPQFAPVQVGMLGGVTVDPRTGQPTLRQDPRTQAIQSDVTGLLGELRGGTAGGAGRIGEVGREQLDIGQGMLAAVQDFDPLNLAEQRFDRLSGVLGKSRDKQRAELEERMFRQGRLDSGVSHGLTAELEGQFGREDAQLLDQLLSSAEQSRRDEISAATGVSGEGARMQGGLMAQLVGGAGVPQQLDAGLLQALGASQGISQVGLNQQIARNQAIQGHNQIMAAKDGGGGGIGAGIGAVAGGALGFFGGGPAGALTGAQAGAAVGGGLENVFAR